MKLPFPLLSDAAGAAGRAYGTAVEKDGKVDYEERVTFVIDPRGRVVKVLEGKDALDPAPTLKACPLHEAH